MTLIFTKKEDNFFKASFSDFEIFFISFFFFSLLVYSLKEKLNYLIPLYSFILIITGKIVAIIINNKEIIEIIPIPKPQSIKYPKIMG